jgi:hypothetical protein
LCPWDTLDNPDQVVEVRGEQVLASEVEHDTLLRAAVFPVGLDESDVLVGGAGAPAGLDGA